VKCCTVLYLYWKCFWQRYYNYQSIITINQLHWICFWQMPATINYQAINICSFNHATDWPMFDGSSTHLIWCCTLLQHTIVISFIIGPCCLVSRLSCLIMGPSCLGRVPTSAELSRILFWISFFSLHIQLS